MATRTVTQFSRTFRDHFGRLPVWLPGTPVSVGDIGVITDGHWRKVGRIENKGVTLAVESGTAQTSYELTTSAGVQVGLNLDGAIEMDGVGKGNAGISFTFDREGTFAFLAMACTIDHTSSLLELQQTLTNLALRGAWDASHIVVTSTVAAERVISAVSGSTNGKANLDLGVSADHTATVPVLLAQAGAKAVFGWTRDMAATFVTSTPSVVMFDAWQIKQSIIRGPKMTPVTGSETRYSDSYFPIVTPLTEL